MMKKIISLLLIVILFASAVYSQKAECTKGYKIGDYEVFVLCESQHCGNTDILIGLTPEIKEKHVSCGTFATAINSILVKSSKGIYLIDAGTCPNNLCNGLKSLGIAPEDINIVYLTHMHGDHIGGLLRDGKKVFPKALLSVSSPECFHWSSNKKMNASPASNRAGFIAAQKTLNAYGKNLEVSDPDDINSGFGNGINVISAYGHTPGHVAYLIKSGEEQLLVWGDLTHAMDAQMPYPEIAVSYDMDPGEAVKSRLAILRFVAEHKIPVVGMHVPSTSPGIIEALPEGGYKFTAVAEK